MSAKRLLASALPWMVAIQLGYAAPARADEEGHDHSDHAERAHRYVRISASGLHPREQQAGPEDALGWVNYSSKLARVSFDSDVAKHMVCTTRTSFQLTGQRLESAPIRAQSFASLCQLEPGEYAYKVQLYKGAGGSTQPFDREFEGRITVTADPAGD